MGRAIILLIVLAACLAAYGQAYRPVSEYSTDRQYFRIVNTSDESWYCEIELGNGMALVKMLNPYQSTRWYPTEGGFFWSCE